MESGLILVNKPEKITSFELISKIKKILGIKKIGHSGILDKEASGLMLVCFGKATKMLGYLIGLPKRYIGRIKFGAQTTTDDIAGSIIKSYDGEVSFELIKEKFKKYIGKIEQIPPDYSSVHINGERAYKLALKQKEFNIKPREIEIYELNILDYENSEVIFDIKCSSGTYIRAIARDIGIDTGYFAHLSYLKRIEIGDYNISNAYSLQDIQQGYYTIIEPKNILYMYDIVEIKEEFISSFKQGKLALNMFNSSLLKDNIYRVCSNDIFLGLIKYENNKLTYEFVY